METFRKTNTDGIHFKSHIFFVKCLKNVKALYEGVRLFVSVVIYLSHSAFSQLNHTFLAYFYHLYKHITYNAHSNTGRKQVCWKSFFFLFILIFFPLFLWRTSVGVVACIWSECLLFLTCSSILLSSSLFHKWHFSLFMEHLCDE